MNDLVSVIIGTYERYELLQRSIESVFNQSYKNIELIVVDDCSKDERYKSLIGSTNFKFIQLSKNSGMPAVPRNVGIKLSRGKWISFLDDDDYFLSNKIEKQLSLTDKYDFICSEAIHDDKNSKYAKGLYLDYWYKINTNNTNEFDYSLIRRHNLIINSSVLIKRDILEKVEYITEDIRYRRAEDYHTWLKALQVTNFCYFIEEPLLYYNIHSEKK
jgi:teichuronic acid biosynthesis glycosyltransferase TuaG